jgi:hypothetical protein
MRNALARLLRGLGCRVIEASSARGGRRVARGHPETDLLFVNVSAAENGMLEFAQWFRDAFPGARVLAASGFRWDLTYRIGCPSRLAYVDEPFTAIGVAERVWTTLMVGVHRPLPPAG